MCVVFLCDFLRVSEDVWSTIMYAVASLNVEPGHMCELTISRSPFSKILCLIAGRASGCPGKMQDFKFLKHFPFSVE